MGLINQLQVPVGVVGEWGESISLTHEAYGMTLQPWNAEHPLIIYTTNGVVKQDGSYRAYPGTEKYAYCKQADLDALLAANAETGKPAGIFRLDDIQALYALKTAPPAPQEQPA